MRHFRVRHLRVVMHTIGLTTVTVMGTAMDTVAVKVTTGLTTVTVMGMVVMEGILLMEGMGSVKEGALIRHVSWN